MDGGGGAVAEISIGEHRFTYFAPDLDNLENNCTEESFDIFQQRLLWRPLGLKRERLINFQLSTKMSFFIRPLNFY